MDSVECNLSISGSQFNLHSIVKSKTFIWEDAGKDLLSIQSSDQWIWNGGHWKRETCFIGV